MEREPLRKSTGRGRNLPPGSVRADPRAAVCDQALRESIDAVAAQVAAAARLAAVRRRRRPAPLPAPHRGPLTPDRRLRRRPHRRGAGTGFVVPCGAWPTRHRQDVHAARVIAELVTIHRWRVGVVAQSHAVVENLFRDIIGAGVDSRPGRQEAQRQRPVEPTSTKRPYPAFIGENEGGVIGGTAWDFANANRVPPGSLDLLVIEEAGQFCLANTIAVAPAATTCCCSATPSSCRR